MKPNPKSALAAATLVLAASSAFAQIQLSDDFNAVGVGFTAFNDNAALVADQAGTLATKDYSLSSTGWDGYVQRGAGGQMLLAGYDFPVGGSAFAGQVFASVNYNFASDANTLNAPLEIKFNLNVKDSADASNWGTIALGAIQNAFVNDSANKFSSLFRDNGETQQFASGADVTPVLSPFTFTDDDLITLMLSDTAGTGSAFNGNGSVAKMYVNGVLKATFTGLGLGAGDGYISFQAFGTKALYDNLVITALTTATDYDTWAGPSGFNLSGGPTADDDNDGLTNHQEYAFGLIPNSGASVNPITAQLDKSTGTFSYTRRKPSFGTNLTYSVWFSENLADWTKDTGATEGTLVPSGDNETVPVTLSTLPGNPLPAKLFIQVRAN